MVDGLVSGLASWAPLALVWNRFQPPCDGGSFLRTPRSHTAPVRELHIHIQPIFFSRSAVTRLIR